MQKADERSKTRRNKDVAAEPRWRIMRPQDIDAVCRIAAICHPDLPESKAILAEKQRLGSHYCLTLAQARPGGGEEIFGYMLAHPWRRGATPKLNSLLGAIPPNADIIYLHDLALAPAARGQRLAEAAVAELCACAAQSGFAEINLVSVHNSATFWQKQGFAAQASQISQNSPAEAAHSHNIAHSYGADAVFMVKNLRA